MANVLIVEDEELVRGFLVANLEQEGHTVTACANGAEALAWLSSRSAHLVITDLRMPRVDGLSLLRAIRRQHPDVEVIVLTGHGSVESAVEAMKEGAVDFLEKPLKSPAVLRLIVARALERHRHKAVHEITAVAPQPPLGYGSPAMRAVESVLRKVARTDATVLLLGESGSGKEVAARAVHDWSERAEGPFVAVNCAALSAQLLESELFGHEKGAFTGAYARQRGRIELAEGGSFFLDEIGELELGLQAKLLRVLQERRFERVGGRQSVDANVRWIAASNRDLVAMVASGAFRQDLYHRLAAFPVYLPPLRDRPEDIAPLAERLLAQIAASLGRPGLVLTEDARELLTSLPWPGNVRELANVLERSAIVAEGMSISAADLLWRPPERPQPRAMSGEPTPRPALAWSPLDVTPEQGQAASLDDAGSEDWSVEEPTGEERRRIAAALESCAGNQTRAARLLGISRSTLVARLTAYELPRPRKRLPTN